MGADTPRPRRTLEGVELEDRLAEIQKGHQLAGHEPDELDMDMARRILTGELSAEAAAEIEERFKLRRES